MNFLLCSGRWATVGPGGVMGVGRGDLTFLPLQQHILEGGVDSQDHWL